MSNWEVISASVVGDSHKESKLPCQDAIAIKENQKWTAVVVCDGAGTAKKADEGAQFFSSRFSEVLINLSKEIDTQGLGTWITDYLVANITTLRNELRSKYKTDKLNDFHCTLVSVLLGEKGGLMAHVGDGAIFGGQAIKDKKGTNLSNDLFYSQPENGQYSNETFFITENSWIKHLRVTPISSTNWICLGTDGGMALAMQNESEVKSGFVAPVIKEIVLSKDSQAKQKKIKDIITAKETSNITGDDKTLAFIFNKEFYKLSNDYFFDKSEKNTAIKNKTQNKPNAVNQNQVQQNKTNSPSVNAVHYKENGWLDRLTKFLIFLIIIILIAIIYIYVQQKKEIENLSTINSIKNEALENQHRIIEEKESLEKPEKKDEEKQTDKVEEEKQTENNLNRQKDQAQELIQKETKKISPEKEESFQGGMPNIEKDQDHEKNSMEDTQIEDDQNSIEDKNDDEDLLKILKNLIN